MRGYPSFIATKQDFENLLAMPQFRAQALRGLQQIHDTKDDKATRVVSGSEETKDLITEEISNPAPLWKQKGFKDKEEILVLMPAIAEIEAEKVEAKEQGW